MKHRVGNRRGDFDATIFAESFRAERIHDLVVLLDEDYLEIGNVGVEQVYDILKNCVHIPTEW